MSTTINNRIICNQQHANLDEYYGPYDSVREALEALNTQTIAGVTYTKRAIGLTVGIMENREVVEYWFKSGTKDGDLVKKTVDGGLPKGIKVVTFDKNGGSGVQPSLLTDMDGYVVMPTHSVTRSGYNFTGWKLGAITYQEGVEVHVTDNTSFVAQWEQKVQNYTVSWVEPTGATIDGECNGNSIDKGESCVGGSTIVLTAKAAEGYNIIKWDNTPTGATISGDSLTFTLNDNVSGVSVITKAIVTQYQVNFSGEEGVKVTGNTKDGNSFNTGSKLDERSIIVINAKLTEGYETLRWSVEGETEEQTETPTEEGGYLQFTLVDNVTIKASASKKPEGV